MFDPPMEIPGSSEYEQEFLELMVKYVSWIAEHVPDPVGKCEEATEKMADTFPELTRVRGHYLCPVWGPREHWWLVHPDGFVVDPTVEQFPLPLGEYKQWDESQPEPTGECPNCREYCYNGETCCSEQCSREYIAYCQNPFDN